MTVSKLSVESKNTLRDASQVSCSVNKALNRDESLSEPRVILADNLGDENQRVPAGGLKATTLVYVLNQDGSPLMPCKPAKARHLLEAKKAEVVIRTPFTIRVLWECERNVEEVILKIDVGYSRAGLSVATEKKELFSAEVELRNDVSRKLSERRMYRRNRRNRLWYREPRFSNRRRKEGWLAPSIQHKLDAYISLVGKIKVLLPLSQIIVEVAKFDTQKMVNSEISGIDYQHGTLFGYEVWEYLLEKWGHKCAYCGKENTQLEKEHIIPKGRDGTNRVSNLTISCHKCNQNKGNMTAEEFGHPEVQKMAKETLKQAAFMNTVRWKLVNKLKELYPYVEIKHTYGYITRYNREKLGLEKSHINDAFCIEGTNSQERAKPFKITKTRRNNRSLQTNRKGFKPSIRRKRHHIQPNDIVKSKGSFYLVKGVFNYGDWVRLSNGLGNISNMSAKNVELVKYGKGIQFA